MSHARHRSSRRLDARTVLPAVLLTLAGAAFGGLALAPAPASGEPAPEVLAYVADVPVERAFDVPRASRTRELHPLPKPKPKPVVKPPAPRPAPVKAKAKATTPPKAATRLRRSTTSRVFGGRCPVPAASFTDTYGAARSGGRAHRGTDLMARAGSPVYAVASGVVDTAYSSNGGISLYLRAANGDRYFYAHNSANIASDGERVQAGQLIARVGNTGNARYTGAHVHFEREVGGRSVNPYPFLRALC